MDTVESLFFVIDFVQHCARKGFYTQYEEKGYVGFWHKTGSD